jgi:membrane protease YdiL (CAAX protease family)
VEELAFRGYLMRRLTAAEFGGVTPARVSILALSISALLFGLLHQH